MVALNLTGIFLPSLIASLMRGSKTGEPLYDSIDVKEEYDYVIVGSGWGGSILANRLSADPATSVLLLEAGAKDNVSTEIPLLSISKHGEGFDWQYWSKPQKSMCWGNPGKRCALAAGKVAGGTSTIGELIFERGNKEDLDRLGKILPGWSYNEVLPFYKKWEDFHNQKNECVEDEENSCGGEVYIGPPPPGTIPETTEYFIEGAKELLGLKEMRTIKDEEAIERGHFFIKNGVRVNAATAFLKPIAQKRENLHISLHSFVNKIIIDPVTKRATGVEFEKDGMVQKVNAKKEILLSAGVYQSPKILMLSGIGPKDHLQKFQIPVIVDLPGVGQNFRDYSFSTIPFTSNRNISEERLHVFSVKTFNSWQKGQGGIMTTPTGLDAGFSYRSSFADPDSTGPDTAFIFQSLELHEVFAFYLQRALGYSDKTWKSIFEPEINKDMINIQVTIGNYKSIGTVELQSANPKDHPVIDPNYFNDPEENDMKAMMEGMLIARKFENTTAFKQHGYKVPRRAVKECSEITNYESMEALKCYLKYGSTPRWCSCCSNKMGPESDSMAVVDGRLRVYGVSGLRVVDASVMPEHFRSPPAATVIMIGEKAAHMIKEDNA